MASKEIDRINEMFAGLVPVSGGVESQLENKAEQEMYVLTLEQMNSLLENPDIPAYKKAQGYMAASEVMPDLFPPPRSFADLLYDFKEGNLSKLVKKKQLTPDEVKEKDRLLSIVTGSLDREELKGAAYTLGTLWPKEFPQLDNPIKRAEYIDSRINKEQERQRKELDRQNKEMREREKLVYDAIGRIEGLEKERRSLEKERRLFDIKYQEPAAKTTGTLEGETDTQKAHRLQREAALGESELKARQATRRYEASSLDEEDRRIEARVKAEKERLNMIMNPQSQAQQKPGIMSISRLGNMDAFYVGGEQVDYDPFKTSPQAQQVVATPGATPTMGQAQITPQVASGGLKSSTMDFLKNSGISQEDFIATMKAANLDEDGLIKKWQERSSSAN